MGTKNILLINPPPKLVETVTSGEVNNSIGKTVINFTYFIHNFSKCFLSTNKFIKCNFF